MRRIEEGEFVGTVRFEMRDGEIVAAEGDDEERISLLSSRGLELESISDLEAIENLVADALLRHQPEDEFFASMAEFGPGSEAAGPGIGRQGVIEVLQEMKEDRPSLFSLHAALLAVGEAWREEGVNAEHIGVLFAFEPFGEIEVQETAIEAVNPTPVWILEPGSLASFFATLHGIYRAGKWMLIAYGLTRPQFTRARDASNWFTAELRKRAAAAQPKPKDLLQLDASDLFTKRPKDKYDTVLIFLHGLFSTDIGTFEGFRDVWQDLRNEFRKSHGNCADVVFGRISVLGWPHDTMVTINENADDLADLICDRFGETDYRIVFVCHSRGGLLARAAVQKLLRRPSYNWDQRIRGVATFGTPHHGALLAKTPGRYQGAYLLLLKGTHRLIALDLLFVYKHHRRRIDGIDDLAPVNNPISDFLHRLERDERKFPPKCFVTVGGDVSQQPGSGASIWNWVRRIAGSGISRLAGSPNHDVVVTTQSSLPTWAVRPLDTDCNHFEYFDSNQRSIMRQVADELATWLEIEHSIEACTKKSGPNEVEMEEDGIWFGDQFVEF